MKTANTATTVQAHDLGLQAIRLHKCRTSMIRPSSEGCRLRPAYSPSAAGNVRAIGIIGKVIPGLQENPKRVVGRVLDLGQDGETGVGRNDECQNAEMTNDA